MSTITGKIGNEFKSSTVDDLILLPITGNDSDLIALAQTKENFISNKKTRAPLSTRTRDKITL
jgi:hypothetical protein